MPGRHRMSNTPAGSSAPVRKGWREGWRVGLECRKRHVVRGVGSCGRGSGWGCVGLRPLGLGALRARWWWRAHRTSLKVDGLSEPLPSILAVTSTHLVEKASIKKSACSGRVRAGLLMPHKPTNRPGPRSSLRMNAPRLRVGHWAVPSGRFDAAVSQLRRTCGPPRLGRPSW
jgi:hypothetical protein